MFTLPLFLNTFGAIALLFFTFFVTVTTEFSRIMGEKMEISAADPLKDYKRLMETYVVVDRIMPDDEIQENFRKVAEVAHKTIWQLLFDSPADQQQANTAKAIELLTTCKKDACFHSPWLYNEWIVSLRDELLKRKMLDVWRNSIVKEELGPCSRRDCDMFDAEDELPFDFYDREGAKAPFVLDTRHNFNAELGNDAPLADYMKLIKEQLQSDEIVEDAILEANGKKIFEAAQKKIWQLLFEEQPPKLAEAAALLKEYKSDATFYAPWPYNEWIVGVRDELIKRKMLEFWRDEIVKGELGPCWARDSDYFDDMTDPEPEAFYNYGGCKAPFQRRSSTEEKAAQEAFNKAAEKCGVVIPHKPENQ